MNGMLVVYIGFIASVNVIEQILFDIHKPMFVYSIFILVYFIPKTTPGLTIKGSEWKDCNTNSYHGVFPAQSHLGNTACIVAMVKLG